MQKIIVLISGTILLAACQATPADTAAVEQVVVAYFEGIRANDQVAAEAVCTDDYTLVEDGLFWNNDSLFAAVAPMFEQGATITYRFERFHTTIKGNFAWTYYHNYGLMTMGGKETPLHWVESALFVYANATWKMALLHSTRLEET